MIQFRKSRLHDEKGNLASASEILRFPIIVFQAVLRKIFGYYPKAPIIPYSARKALNALITSKMRLIEFGSGQSTLWYAQRCYKIISHETTDKWFEKVEQNLARANCQNAELVRWDGASFGENVKNPSPDLIIVDGINRVICIEYAIDAATNSTWIYLDNSDKDMDPPDPDREMRTCERKLIEFANSQERQIEYFTGFAPAQAFAEQGMLVYPKRLEGA